MIYPKMFNNFSYILNKKTSNSIRLFILLLIISLILFIVISIKFEYYEYKKYLGYVKLNENFNILVYILEEDVNKIVNANKCNEKKFKIVNIGDKYIVDNKKVVLIKLYVNLEKNELIDNNIVELNFKLNKTTIYKKIRKEIKQWIN